jgi:hypothetical protein
MYYYLNYNSLTEYVNDRTILRDEDSSTVVEGGWKKLNTLKHYRVKEGATFRLVQRRDYAPPGRGKKDVPYIF